MKRLLCSFVVLSLLAVGAPTTEAATTHTRTIDTASAGPKDAFLKFDTALAAFDFDGDGRMEIIGHNENRHVYVFDSRDGRIVADIVPTYPSSWGARPINAPEVAILEHGKAPHIVIANSAAYISVFRYDGKDAGGLQFTKVWERRMTECFGNPGMDAQPVLHDLDGDGKLEILVQTEEVGVYALRMDGSTMWKQCIGGGNGEPAVADMDFDGVPDVIFASDDGTVTRINGRGGWTVWTFRGSAPEWGLGVASMPVGPTIGQIDGKGGLDIAVGARDSHDRADPHNNRAALFAINGDTGKALWMRQHPQGTPLTYTHPIIHDVDKDGEMDVLWGDWNTVGHFPPWPGDAVKEWAVSGTPAIYRYDSTGDLRYRRAIGSYWSNNDLALADVDGDGWQELIVDNGASMIYVDSRTGTTKATVGLNGWIPTRGPTVYPIHGDGTMQWLLPVHKGNQGGVMLFDTGAPYNSAWPHVPTGKAALPHVPPGTFAATFTVPDTTNNWWIEVYVSSSTPISSVSAVINGGPTPLTKASWGGWTTSVYVADGSEVVFKARDALGREATSAKYSWGKGGAPPPSGFQATFAVPDSTNNWWIETRIDANAPIAGVTASVDGGTGKALAKTDWGTWAKSFYVPNGATVIFTATSSSGATATSKSYSWGQAAPPPSSDFAVTWSVPSGANAWWVEVDAKATHPLTGVTVAINGGPARVLDRTNWGTWAKALQAPAGSQMVFVATDVHGHTASHAMTWLDDGKAFSATFAAKNVGNDWWIEAEVKANKPVTNVDVSLNGGAWKPLARTDWGTWAKSLHAPDGTQVQFRATDGKATVLSQTVTWT